MSPLEIALLIGGALIFILSFVIPVKKKETSGEIKEMIGDEVRLKVKSEIEELRSHIDDVVDEAIDYAQEKTERSLERISNEKIMAVNEYSDTVLDEINKNHKEVMFLYDMLSNKHEDLKSAVSEAAVVTKNAKETALEAASAAEAAQESTREAKEAMTNIRSFTPEVILEHQAIKAPAVAVPDQIVAAPSISVVSNEAVSENSRVEEKKTEDTDKAIEENVRPEKEKAPEPTFRTLKWAEYAIEKADEAYEDELKKEQIAELSAGDTSEADASNTAAGGNSVDQAYLRDQVIALHKLGNSDIEIARNLNIGVGEVSLIIGLHAKS